MRRPCLLLAVSHRSFELPGPLECALLHFSRLSEAAAISWRESLRLPKQPWIRRDGLSLHRARSVPHGPNAAVRRRAAISLPADTGPVSRVHARAGTDGVGGWRVLCGYFAFCFPGWILARQFESAVGF